MPKSTVTTPAPPPVRERLWPNPQMVFSAKPPNQTPTNKATGVIKTPQGGGGNP